MVRTEWACVAFTKTAGWEERDRSDDELSSYEGLVRWAEGQGVVDASTAADLRRRAWARPEEAESVRKAAVGFRDVLYGLLTATARDEDPPEGALEEFNATLRDAASRLRLYGEGRSYEWRLTDSARERLEWPLWRVALSAAELLKAEEVERLKLCVAHDCGWLFVDASRNSSRRWCDMAGCGNRAKARRYRERHGS